MKIKNEKNHVAMTATIAKSSNNRRSKVAPTNDFKNFRMFYLGKLLGFFVINIAFLKKNSVDLSIQILCILPLQLWYY